jgi:hypothetical protein
MFLKRLGHEMLAGEDMIENGGKFLIYASNTPLPERLKVIGSAVAKVASSLRLETELSPRRKLLSIHVYYRSDAGDEIPVYSDWGKAWNEEDIYRAIRNMMFVLSFHPRHTNLKTIRQSCLSA